MTLPPPAPSTPRCPWDAREDFLLLPGDGLILVDGEGLVTHFDHKAHQRAAQATGWRCGDQLDALWPELAAAVKEHTLAPCGTGPLETKVACADQICAVRLFRSDAGVGIVLLAERSRNHASSHQQLLMHQRIVQHIRDAVIVTTAEPLEPPGPLIVYANPAALRQTGYRLAEVLGRSPRLFQGPDTDPGARRTFREAMQHWQPVRQSVLNYRKDGSSFWVEIDIAPLEDSDGWHSFWVSVQREDAALR